MGDLELIFSSSEERTNEFEFRSKKVIVKTREIGYSKKNKILGQCFSYKNDGTISFDFEKYNNFMLKEIITYISVGDSIVPKDQIGEILFSRLSVAFGSILEKLVPKAFEQMETSDFFVKDSTKS